MLNSYQHSVLLQTRNKREHKKKETCKGKATHINMEMEIEIKIENTSLKQ